MSVYPARLPTRLTLARSAGRSAATARGGRAPAPSAGPRGSAAGPTRSRTPIPGASTAWAYQANRD